MRMRARAGCPVRPAPPRPGGGSEEQRPRNKARPEPVAGTEGFGDGSCRGGASRPHALRGFARARLSTRFSLKVKIPADCRTQVAKTVNDIKRFILRSDVRVYFLLYCVRGSWTIHQQTKPGIYPAFETGLMELCGDHPFSLGGLK
ncbi:hypothetical protein Y1Q_0022155 [Alligator mississippiensis]|uniref:Uncharacterized protein n=1 Tax=Alligator mississippiensis TaxID=8496 RepID=A0A151P0V7_ALLMI|nr:hypothetical protein Y1Q_0022155 [Alligator mississippiensis]